MGNDYRSSRHLSEASLFYKALAHTLHVTVTIPGFSQLCNAVESSKWQIVPQNYDGVQHLIFFLTSLYCCPGFIQVI